ncbi:hypothetical protein LEN26_013207 [Aphanomyces euteiches]|nr:hypothetical protein LEN26_013207 [Aphanomyces euteiches]
MSDNEEAASVKTRALVLARMVQEAAEAVGTANVGLERAMELLEVSVQQSQELADEAKDNKALTLDEFEAWTRREIAEGRRIEANERLLHRALQSKEPSASKNGAEREGEHDLKRHKSSWGSVSTTRDIATPEFPLGQESPSHDVILVSSDTESQASVDSEDSDQGEHDKTVVLRMAMADVIDASGVHHLRHIEMPELVKAAYMSLESQEPWVHWIGHFRSFLPGLTASQRQWNQRWYGFWCQYGYVVWQRYFFVGVGLYRTNPHAVHQSAQTSRKLLERAKGAMSKLIGDLKEMEGLEVFEFLFFNVHPFWPELALGPCTLRTLAEEQPDGATRAIAYMSEYGHSRFPDFSKYPGLMSATSMASYTFDEAVPPEKRMSWAWQIFHWFARYSSKKVNFVGELAHRLNTGLATQRTTPFPYVQYADEAWCQKPAWLARQDEQTPNLQGMYIAGSGSVRAILRATGEEVAESDVSGIGTGAVLL